MRILPKSIYIKYIISIFNTSKIDVNIFVLIGNVGTSRVLFVDYPRTALSAALPAYYSNILLFIPNFIPYFIPNSSPNFISVDDVAHLILAQCVTLYGKR